MASHLSSLSSEETIYVSVSDETSVIQCYAALFHTISKVTDAHHFQCDQNTIECHGSCVSIPCVVMCIQGLRRLVRGSHLRFLRSLGCRGLSYEYRAIILRPRFSENAIALPAASGSESLQRQSQALLLCNESEGAARELGKFR